MRRKPLKLILLIVGLICQMVLRLVFHVDVLMWCSCVVNEGLIISLLTNVANAHKCNMVNDKHGNKWGITYVVC